MKKKILIILIGILILSNCKQSGGIEYSFEDVQVNTSDDYLTLPTGIIKNKVDSYEEGFYQHFVYPDNRYVIILRGGNAELNEPKNDNPEIHSREQSVDRIRMIYGNVKTERKAEFDKAFDLMKENGLKKK
ncbi:hypothetical protein LX77_03906 [Gelidibacter algens]|uniref:Uncharacterized protein n=1 Tax=Gelidibacter algens TaxID=49280 RepID=A0A1A7QH37_9FLAO|nr:hypothetical protein [Gelidibacter algens]OBX18711.1 hypothetical protein A9996_18995 [Gelidibacter algens]RAJ16754.1 hypothetical protein LX77_03906 [Gelidibacter algens]